MKKIELVYERLMTGVTDLRCFKDEDELIDWWIREIALEPINVIFMSAEATNKELNDIRRKLLYLADKM